MPVPEIARFYGIVVKMFFKSKEHEPSYIHALYGEYMGEFNIQTMEMLQGDLPRKAQNWCANGCPPTRRSFKPCGTASS